MELQELLERLRVKLDDAVEPYLWSDPTLIGHLNDAVRQVCLRARAIVDSETAGVVQHSLPVDTRYVRLHPSILAVRAARIVGRHYQLTGTTAKRLWKRKHAWEVSDAGTPEYWIPDFQEGRLYFDRPVDAESVLRLSVWRLPLETEVMEEPDDEPAISEGFHLDLLDWAAYCAYSQKDTEQNDDRRAADAENAFTAKVGRLPNMTEIRLWGISPIVGVPAEFL